MTLVDPNFVKLLNDNNFLVWGGDVRDRIPWDGEYAHRVAVIRLTLS